MALVTVNGLGVVRGTIRLPQRGVWQADLTVNADAALDGAVTLSIADGALTLSGTVQRAGVQAGASYARILGGAGGLGRAAREAHYNNPTVQIVLADLLREAGEHLSPTADAAILATRLDAWTTVGQPIGLVIALLLAAAAPTADWRIAPDGGIWVGVDTWPQSAVPEAGVQVLDQAPSRNMAILGVETPTVLPGTTLFGRRIACVEHTIDDQPRAVLWFDEDRLAKSFAGAVRGALPQIDYQALYLARVVRKHQGDSLIDVAPLDPRVPSMGSVPLLLDPGVSVELQAGGLALVGWSGGNPSKPYATSFSSDVSAKAIALTADTVYIGGTAGAEAAIRGETYRSAESTLNNAIASAATTAAGGATDPAVAAFLTTLAGALQTFEGSASTFLATAARVK